MAGCFQCFNNNNSTFSTAIGTQYAVPGIYYTVAIPRALYCLFIYY